MWCALSVIVVLVSSTTSGTAKSISEQKCDQFYSSDKIPLQQFSESVTSELVKPGEFPYLASLAKTNLNGTILYACTAILVDPKYVMGAANCAKNNYFSPTFVRFSAENLHLPAESNDFVAIKNIIIHQNYTRRGNSYNVALFELEREVSIRPACLWRNANIPNNETILVVHNLVDGRPAKLLKARTKLYSTDECQDFYKIFTRLTDFQICAMELNLQHCREQDVGQLITQKQVGENHIPHAAGLSSFGIACKHSFAPTVFSIVSLHVDWIESTIWSGSQSRVKINREPIPYLIYLKNYRKHNTPFTFD